jgi:metallo-beta-lactamase family protein
MLLFLLGVHGMYTIKHHGAVNGVTGSCHQLSLDGSGFSDINSRSVLIDCGLFQGDESFDRESDDSTADSTADSNSAHLKQIDFPIDDVKALLVTHCHIDHVGRIPYLLAAGFTGPIYATKATALLLPLVIEDAIKVGVTRNRSIIRSVMKRFKSQLVAIEYDEWFAVEGFSDVSGSSSGSANKDEKLKAKFKVAGHIIGSAYIEFDVLGDKGNTKRVVFSGDLGAPYSPLLPAPKSPYRCDELVIESTYGDRCHESRHQRRKLLQDTLERCLENKGTVLIPAFSIGRTQELLYEIEEMIHAGKLKGIDVIVDSPLASGFTEHYRELKYLWDKEAQRKVASGRHPLSFESLLTIDSHQEHEKLLGHLKDSGRAAIVIAASGMCSGGRMQNYLQELLPDERTDVIFVGYQAKGTPGRDIQRYGAGAGSKEKRAYVQFSEDGRKGDKVAVRAGVYTLGGYSAHADQKDLVNFVKRMRVRPSKIRIVHGDDGAKLALKGKYEGLFGCEVLIPVG